jgi:hypothetical protein
MRTERLNEILVRWDEVEQELTDIEDVKTVVGTDPASKEQQLLQELERLADELIALARL